jgi:hypothetical protein
MGNGLTLTRGARLAGALVCAALAVAEVAWTAQDVVVLGPSGLLRLWVGMTGVSQVTGPPVTSVLDPMLAVLYTAVAVAAFRSAAVGAFIAAAAVTLAVRVPSVQILGTDINAGLADSLTRLQLTALGGLVGSGVLLVSTTFVRRGTDRPPALRPRPVAGVLAGLLLLAIASLTTLSQLRWTDFVRGAKPPGYNWTSVNGGFAINSLLGPPFEWLTWAATALAVLAALTALVRVPLARPLCSAVAWLLPFSALPVILPRPDEGAVTMAQLTAAFTVVAAPMIPLLMLPAVQPFDDGYQEWNTIPDTTRPPGEVGAATTLGMAAYRDVAIPAPPRPAPPLRRGPDPAGQWYRY